MNIELGGGENPKTNYKNIDLIDADTVDIPGVNFEIGKLPLDDNTVDNIFCSHCLEHIENTRHFLNECHRVLKKGGKAKFITPYGLWPNAQKPVHKNIITEAWYDFLKNENTKRVYGYEIWKIEKIKKNYKKLDEKAKERYNEFEIGMLFKLPYELEVTLIK